MQGSGGVWLEASSFLQIVPWLESLNDLDLSGLGPDHKKERFKGCSDLLEGLGGVFLGRPDGLCATGAPLPAATSQRRDS